MKQIGRRLVRTFNAVYVINGYNADAYSDSTSFEIHTRNENQGHKKEPKYFRYKTTLIYILTFVCTSS